MVWSTEIEDPIQLYSIVKKKLNTNLMRESLSWEGWNGWQVSGRLLQEGRPPISAKWVDLVDHTSLAWRVPRVRIAMAATGSEQRTESVLLMKGIQ